MLPSQVLLNHELTVSHGFAPVQHIDLVLLKENMNNMKRLLGHWEKDGLLRIRRTQLFQYIMTTQQSTRSPTQLMFP